EGSRGTPWGGGGPGRERGTRGSPQDPAAVRTFLYARAPVPTALGDISERQKCARRDADLPPDPSRRRPAGHAGRASQRNTSRFPFGPGSTDSASPRTVSPSARDASRTRATAAARTAGSRTTPPPPTQPRPPSTSAFPPPL